MSQPLYIAPPFVGREDEQKLYRHLLKQAFPWLLIFTGEGGVGKSALLRHLAEQTRQAQPGIAVIEFDFAGEALRSEPDPIKVMEELSWRLARYCNRQLVEAFDQKVEEGRNKLSELNQQLIQLANVGEGGTLSGAQFDISVEPEALRKQRHQVRDMVMKAFYRQLVSAQTQQLVVLLDTCEWLSEPEGLDLGGWVMDELITGMHERLADTRCLFVIASRVAPRLNKVSERNRYARQLAFLDQAAVEQYLVSDSIAMQDAALRRRVYDVTRGHALCVSIIGDLWQKRGDRPFTLVDLPRFQSDFTEKALVEYAQKRLGERLQAPFRELTRYGVILRRYNLPMLQAVFPEYFQKRDALDIFHQLNDFPYVESLGDQYHAFHDLLREIQAAEIRKQQPSEWQIYHQRALEYLTQNDPVSPDRYYHMIALDEEQGISDWWDAVTNPRHYGSYLGALFQAANDVTLTLSPIQAAHRFYRTGVNNYMGARMADALACYQEAFSLYRQVGSRLGEANVLQAMGDVQQFRDDREAALASYEQALSLFRQVGSSLGEANCYLAQGRVALQQEHYQEALELHNNAYRLYQQIQDGYSQARLLYSRSMVYEAMDDRQHALADAERGLSIALRFDLPFADVFQRRVDELKDEP